MYFKVHLNNLIDYMKKGECEIGTLASEFSSNSELDDKNVNEDAEQQMEIFKKYTLLLDEKRDQSIEKQLPKLWSRLKWK